MLIDTHSHVNFNAFRDDSQEVLKRALENDTWVIMPGSQYSTSQRAVEIAEHFENGVFAAVGIHPIHLEQREVDVMEVQSGMSKEQPWMTFETRAEGFDYEKYKQLALSEPRRGGASRRVVAIGEVGLDYYYEPKGKEKRETQRRKQKSALALQVKLAQELDLPVIFHCRKAHDDLIEFLSPHKGKIQGVAHSYTGDLKQAEKLYELGLYFGFNGLIFKNVPALPDPKAVISALPLERIVVETDSPYLAVLAEVLTKAGAVPVTRNEPLFVKYVAQEIARIKNISFEKVAEITTQNALTLFHLGGNEH